jgi:ABC-type phosphate transport system substrate-binding protein
MRTRVLGVVLLGLVAALPADVRAADIEVLGGEAFTDPSEIQRMPGGWASRPIQYEPSSGDADLVVSLDQHLHAAVQGFITEFASERGLKVDVSEGTCGISAGKLAGKAVDIGGFCCPPGRSDRLPGLLFHTLGIEPVVLIVHPDNPIRNITLKEARAVFQGKLYRWSEVSERNGSDFPIQTVGRLHCKSRPGHWRLLLDNEDLFSPRLTEVGSIKDMLSVVSANPWAMGYEAIQMVRLHEEGKKVKVLRLDGLDPEDPASLFSGGYPLYRTLTLTTWEGDEVGNPHARELVEHLLRSAERLGPQFGIVPASKLRQLGWKFRGDELVAEPG